MDGYEVARRIRARGSRPRPLLVGISGYGFDADRRRAKDAGFDLYLVKPVDPQRLEKLVEQWSRTRQVPHHRRDEGTGPQSSGRLRQRAGSPRSCDGRRQGAGRGTRSRRSRGRTSAPWPARGPSCRRGRRRGGSRRYSRRRRAASRPPGWNSRCSTRPRPSPWTSPSRCPLPQSKTSTRGLLSRWSMLPILPMPPTASRDPSGENASARMPPIECRLWTGSQV